MKKFNANGKLLLTGEYLVLDGALALALPTNLGQSLTIEAIKEQKLVWESLDSNNSSWFQHSFPHFHKKIDNNPVAERLRLILLQAQEQNPHFLKKISFKAITKLTFPRNWGLGTSSTLIYLIAQWAKCDPFELLFKAFGGSGYDIACAGANSSITYQLKEKNNPVFESAHFNPSFKDQLYFIYLDKKQDSKKGIARYKKLKRNTSEAIEIISGISKAIIGIDNFNDFESLMKIHEIVISEVLEMEKVQSIYFNDYWGVVKSLGAWGGDFVLATSNRNYTETKKYFNGKGISSVFKV